jgi:hypothetical protein
MKIDRLDLIDNLVWYAMNKVVFKRPSNINTKVELNELVNKISYSLYADGANEIPTQNEILLRISTYKQIDKLILSDNYVIRFNKDDYIK